MSLVGSLGDLGLGDILQIVSLSRKSGLLELRSDAGCGHIVLIDGRVRGAALDAEPDGLRETLVEAGFVAAEDFKLAVDAASDCGIALDEALAERTGMALERIASLLREHVEQAILEMLSWRSGEFSFELRDAIDPPDREPLLRGGIDAQYFAMEATRLDDEGLRAQGAAAAARRSPQSAGPLPGADPVRVTTPADRSPVEIPVSDVRRRAERGEGSPVPTAAPPAGVPLVAIDPSLAVLEWLKESLDAMFARIHIFQQAEPGMARIRQYLSRGIRPFVIFGVGDAAAGDADELERRLGRLAPGLPLLHLRDGPAQAAGELARPRPHALSAPGSADVRDQASRLLRDAVAHRVERAGPATADPAPPRPPGPEPGKLKRVSRRLRDPSGPGEVLALVLELAAEWFDRVAVFAVRDGKAVGLGQCGMTPSGGPDDAALRSLRIPLPGPPCFAQVLERRVAYAGPPRAGDRELAQHLGSGVPTELYVAPIEAGGDVAALLYADNLPGGQALADAPVLEVVLQQAGLALDRDLLQRALATLEAERRGA